jgi:hypothetical protein
LALSAVAVLLLSAAPWSTLPAAADDPSPPGVARIDLIQGDVGVRSDEAGETVAAVVNAPVLEGDYISTGDSGSAAEVQYDGASLIRIGYDTQVRFVTIEGDNRVAQVAQGTIEERVFDGGLPAEIDTPFIAVRPQGPGAYRIGVADDGSAQITVRSGSVLLESPQGAQTISAGNTANVSGSADQPAIAVGPAVAKDAFDSFNASRDAAAVEALNDPNAPAGLAYDDYAQYGQWVDDPTYGEVWAPTEDANWAPYTNGTWVWAGGYGWTWVSNEPWGWGPYHYGRWFHSPVYGWCWYPPPPQPALDYVWSPALVAFVGFGGASGGFASIGWVPLAPREPFYPWYGWSGGVFVASTTVRTVDITSVTYVNRRWGRMIPIDRWQAGNFAHPARIASADWQNVQAVHGALPVVPTRANLRFTAKPLPATLAKAPIVRPHLAALARTHKAAPSFDQVRAALQTRIESPNAPANQNRAPGVEPRSPSVQPHAQPAPSEYQRPQGNVPVTDGSHGSVPTTYGSHGQVPRTQRSLDSTRPQGGSLRYPADGSGASRQSQPQVRQRPPQPQLQRNAPAPPPKKPAPKDDKAKKP